MFEVFKTGHNVSMWPIFFIAITLFVMSLPVPESKAITFDESTFAPLAQSGRALGMANTHLSLSDSPDSIFYNPAGLGSVRKWMFHLSNFQLETNNGLLGITGNGNVQGLGTKLSKSFTLKGQQELLNADPGYVLGLRTQFMPNLSFRYFSIGFLYASKMRSIKGSGDGNLFEYASRTDMGPYAGLSLSFWGGVFKLGVVGILLTRAEIFGETQESTLSVTSSDYNKGLSLQLTAGARLTIPWAMLPTFSLVMRNAMNQSFSNISGPSAPSKIAQRFDAGFSLSPKLGRSVFFHLVFDYKDMTQRQSFASLQKFSFGAELDFDRFFRVRGGYGAGSYSWGFGVNTKKLIFDIASIAEYLPSGYAIKEKIDRKLVMSVSYGL